VSNEAAVSKPQVFVAAVWEGNPMEYAHGLGRAARSLRAIADIVPVLPDLRFLPDEPGFDRVGWERDLVARCDAVVVIGGRDVRDDVAGAEGVERWLTDAEDFGVPVFDGPGPLVDWVLAR
jgi:hypothetical protein